MRLQHLDEVVTAGEAAEIFLRDLGEEFWQGFRERLRWKIDYPMDFPPEIEAQIA